MNLEYDSSVEICVTGKFIIQMSKVETRDMDSCDHLLVISEIVFQETTGKTLGCCFFLIDLLRYNSYTIQFTHLKDTIQWGFLCITVLIFKSCDQYMT